MTGRIIAGCAPRISIHIVLQAVGFKCCVCRAGERFESFGSGERYMQQRPAARHDSSSIAVCMSHLMGVYLRSAMIQTLGSAEMRVRQRATCSDRLGASTVHIRRASCICTTSDTTYNVFARQQLHSETLLSSGQAPG